MGLKSAHGGPYHLQLASGECVALVGRSGSGKSVLLRMIADLDPHQGEVALDGRLRASWPAPAWRGQVVYQAAEPAWWAYNAAAHIHSVASEPVAMMLARLGLGPELLRADITRLSTGERQRMALVRSLACRPRVLLLDEPTASLDGASTRSVETLLHDKIGSDGLTVLIVTHSREQADRLGHRVLEVRDGQVHPS
ncbi:MAG: hypothetical protein JWQ88_1559 [Rhodoferax sp.]|nr:hypothetical protein [Rhodoferax sp.]